MAKKVLEIKDFTGGLNCYSDPRDIEPNAFAQNWNANVSQSGIIKLGGSLFESIRNLPHDNTNQQMGYGLFTTGVDHSISIIDGEFENGYEEGAIAGYAGGTPTITLAATSTHIAFGDHGTDDFYNNYMITIYKTADGAAPEGETRRITDYVGSTKVATLDSAFSAAPLTNGTEYYRIYRWVGSTTTDETFGNSSVNDCIDKANTSAGSWNDDIESPHENNLNEHFLRTKVTSVGNNDSKNLGWVTYNPSTSSTDLTEDSTTIGATKLKAGVEYNLSFYCKATSRYYGYVSDTASGERVPFVQLYSDSVTDGTTPGLYLSQSNVGPTFLSGADSTYDFADDIAKQYVDNGDFEDGTDTGGDGGRSGTYDPPTGWMAYDGNIDHNNNAITYSTNADSDSFGGEGKTLVMTPGSAFAFDEATNEIAKPNCYMYQDITLEDNQWYELLFAYSSTSDGACFSIVDTFNLTSTGIVADEAESANDSEATLTVKTTTATDALVKNKEIYTNTGGTVKFFGVCDTVDSGTQITFAGGLTEAVSDNDVLSTASYITPWTLLTDTGGVTSYLYVGQNTSSDYIKPHKFFVPNNSGTPRVIRIAFSPAKASVVVRFDGISVKKSFPDLLSMSSKTHIGNPYGSEMTEWTRYQMKFKIPSQYDNASDWVLRLHAGTWGYQAGATYADADYDDNHTVYFDRIRLEATQNDNLIFLNDNTSTESKVMIYSSNSGNWIENDLVWSGTRMQSVFDYMNGILKISDANFDSGNTSKIFYYLKTKKLGADKEIEGYRVRGSGISAAPPLLTTFGQDTSEVTQTFDAVEYSDDYTYASKHQWFNGEETNWPVDSIRNFGRVLHYISNTNSPDDEEIFDPASGNELNDWDIGGYEERILSSQTHPFYTAWAGNDGTNNDMASELAAYTTGSVSRVEIGFTYDFSCAEHSSLWEEDHLFARDLKDGFPPDFTIHVGKMENSVFAGSVCSTDNAKLLLKGNETVTGMVANTVRQATIYNTYDELYEPLDADSFQPRWEDSEKWPWDELQDNSGSRFAGAKSFKASVSFDPDVIAITDDMIMKFDIVYPTPFPSCVSLRHCIRHGESTSWDFPRHELVKLDYINVHFRDNNWSPSADGMGAVDKNKTKVNFGFASPTGSSAVGWEERTFITATTSVNVFDEESTLNINESIVGTTLDGALSPNTSSITAGQAPHVSVYVGYDVAKDEFRNKIKYYMKDTESDIWYLQFFVDLVTNKIYSTTSNYTATGVKDDTNKNYVYTIPREKMLNYNEVDSYESQTMIPQDITSSNLTCDYKASVVANNRLYVGNIKQNGKIHGDRMIKSPICKYNLLPSSNFIDVAINDGDEITALAFYKDKLLQFKKKKVFVINTSGDYEFLEETFDNVGVIGQYQVTSTPYGIAWINSSGCHVYDGKALTNLIDNKIPENTDDAIISENLWNITETSYNSGAISYNAGTKDLVIKTQLGGSGGDGQSSGNTTGTTSNTIPDGYVYNLPTKSWYFTNNGFAPRWGANSTGVTSNFAINEDGDIILYAKDTSTGSYGHRINDILKWDSSKGNDEAILDQRAINSLDNRRPFIFKTADLTFGDITARKKIYKVYVTYKSVDSSGSSANSSVLVKHATNGGTTYTAFDDSSTNYAAATGLTGSTTWATAILKPTSAINNIYSLQLEFSAALGAAVGFQINDISIVYRDKPVK